MEIHPILECGEGISHGLWYVVSSENAPQARVGMACVARTDGRDHSSELFVVGGANPSCTFDDVYKLDLKTFLWSKICGNGLRSRYEHFAYVPCSMPKSIYTFGGANESGNLNSMQVYDVKKGLWSDLNDIPDPPTPRTIHCAGSSGDKLYIYGGGLQGADPVPDKALHVFCSQSKQWSKYDLMGDVPSPRHGHVMVVIGSKLYIHGGMAGTNFYDDIFVVDLLSFKSLLLKKMKYWPCARAGHCGSVYDNTIFIFGGMCQAGALDDMLSFDIKTLSWTLLKFDCPPPPPRLDHSMVCTMLPVKKSISKNIPKHDAPGETVDTSNVDSLPNKQKPNIVAIDDWQVTIDGSAENLQKLDITDSVTDVANQPTVVNEDVEYDFVPVCIIMGGMDTTGNIFNDVFLTRIEV